MVDYLRLVFWGLACLVLVPLCVVSWLALFWLNPDDLDDEGEDDEI